MTTIFSTNSGGSVTDGTLSLNLKLPPELRNVPELYTELRVSALPFNRKRPLPHYLLDMLFDYGLISSEPSLFDHVTLIGCSLWLTCPAWVILFFLMGIFR